MNFVTYLYALSSPDPEYLGVFVDYVRSTLGPSGDVRVAVESAEVLPALEGVRYFPAGTRQMSMFNQLAADEKPGQVLFFSQGTALPRLGEAVGQVASLSEGTFVTLDGRRPILSQQLELEEMLSLDWDEVEFTRSVHEESPLGFAVRREDFLRVRGFDERISYNATYVMDLLSRFRRFTMGHLRVDPMDGYAIDLDPVFPGLTSEPLPQNVSVRENQKAHVQSDPSIFRNLVDWSVPRPLRPVLVSVSIATRDRSEYLLDSIRSVQAQSFEDWELIVVDDGSEDDTRSVVESVADDRVRYYRQDPTGISSARNRAADESIGYFTAVHDDDDIMLPWRLETSLSVISADARASYGSWVNFDDVTAEMALHITKRSFGKELVAFSGQTPGHATWLLPTAIIRELRYDESLTSSVDHNMAVRTVMSGLTWKHTEKVLFLRRLHPTQVSQTDSRRQRAAAILTRYANTFTADFNGIKAITEKGKTLHFPNPADKQKLAQTFGAFLPDHLVRRTGTVQGLVGKKILALDLHDRFSYIIAETDLLTDRSTLEMGGVSRLNWDDIVAIRQSGFTGFSYNAEVGTVAEPDTENAETGDEQAKVMNTRINAILQDARKASPSAVLVNVEGEHLSLSDLRDAAGLLSAHHFSINAEPDSRVSRLLIGFSNEDKARAFLAERGSAAASWSMVLPVQRDITVAVQRHLGV
ncbi:glycosyltransferase family 2 protein [Arthrobacter sp. NPDC055585]